MRVAITGLIGSGKSEVLRYLSGKGCRTLSADSVNRELLADPSYIEKLKNIFPKAVRNGAVDRKLIAEIIYNDEGKRNELNALAHPIITKTLIDRSNYGLWFIEAPLLMDDSAYKFDKIWKVEASEGYRLDRVAKRDHITPEFVSKILAAQRGYPLIDDMYCDILDNDGDINRLLRQVDKLCANLPKIKDEK